MVELYIKQGRMEQSIENLNEWITKCDPKTDNELLAILETKLNHLLTKLNFIKNNG